MDEKTAGSSPIRKLKARLQLWHYSKQEGWSLEFNSLLAMEAEKRFSSDWEVHRAEGPEIPCRPGQKFVAIETEFVHRSMPHNHRLARYEWNKLWTMIPPFTEEFFAQIKGQAIIIKMMSPDYTQAGQPLFISIDTRGPLRLRQKIVPTPRPKREWLEWFKRWRNRVVSFTLLSVSSYVGLVSRASAVNTMVAIEATSAVLDYMKRRRQSPGLLSEDPAQRVARTFGGYRRQYASLKDFMSRAQEVRCPDIGIRRLEACRSLLIEFGEFETATLSHLSTDIEPSCQRKGRHHFAKEAGKIFLVAGGLLCVGAWLASSATLLYCAGGVTAVGSMSWVYGYFDPNRENRELIQQVRDLFKSVKRTLHVFYIRMWIAFYQDVLGVPFTRLSKQDGFELLKNCAVDLTVIQEVGYQKAIEQSTMNELDHHSEEFMEKLHELYKAVGQELIVQDVPGED